jgi:hypothetical protein
MCKPSSSTCTHAVVALQSKTVSVWIAARRAMDHGRGSRFRTANCYQRIGKKTPVNEFHDIGGDVVYSEAHPKRICRLKSGSAVLWDLIVSCAGGGGKAAIPSQAASGT